MDTPEIKLASRRARVWARLSDPDKPPRCWWFPPSSRRDTVLSMPEAARQDYRKVVQQAHEKFSETVRLTMLSLLGFALFCLLIALSTSDSSLLVANPTIKMPFADVQVSFQAFLVLAPALLCAVTLYLHIFYGYWLDFETDHQQLALNRESGDPSIKPLPTLFSLDHPVPRLLTVFILYMLVPLVLFAIGVRAAARAEWGVPVFLVTGVVTVILLFLWIRRCPASQRQRWIWQRLCWVVMVVMVLISGYMATLTFKVIRQISGEPTGRWDVPFDPRTDTIAVPHFLAGGTMQMRRHSFNDCVVGRAEPVVVPRWLERPLNLFRADLKGQWLGQVKLRGAYADLANLQEADLLNADLRRARLRDADLRGADLRCADLRRAKLQGAKMPSANFEGADLQGAEFQRANLQGADFQGVNPQGINPQSAQARVANLPSTNFQGANLRGAQLWGAWLSAARFRGAQLQGADFQEADLRGAQLQGVDLREVKNLTEAQLRSAKIDNQTLLPDYLTRPRP